MRFVVDGYGREELIGMHLLDLVAREEHFEVWTNTRRAVSGHVLTGASRTHVRKDGTRLKVSVSGSLIEISGWKVFQDIVRDETRRIEAEEALQAKNRELEHEIAQRKHAEKLLRTRNEELKAFAYTVSHDLKAPLRSIAGYAHEYPPPELASAKMAWARLARSASDAASSHPLSSMLNSSLGSATKSRKWRSRSSSGTA